MSLDRKGFGGLSGTAVGGTVETTVAGRVETTFRFVSSFFGAGGGVGSGWFGRGDCGFGCSAGFGVCCNSRSVAGESARGCGGDGIGSGRRREMARDSSTRLRKARARRRPGSGRRFSFGLGDFGIHFDVEEGGFNHAETLDAPLGGDHFVHQVLLDGEAGR